VRIRITRPLSGSIDRIQLGRFDPGQIYEVSTSLGSYLLCERMAEPIADECPALVLPLDDVRAAWAADLADHRQLAKGEIRLRKRSLVIGASRKRH